MQFQELSNDHQDFLIDIFSNTIEEAAEREGIKDYIEPARNQYIKFFNEYDEDYKIVKGYPQSVHDSYHNTYRIEFKGEKVVLIVCDPHEFDGENDE